MEYRSSSHEIGADVKLTKIFIECPSSLSFSYGGNQMRVSRFENNKKGESMRTIYLHRMLYDLQIVNTATEVIRTIYVKY